MPPIRRRGAAPAATLIGLTLSLASAHAVAPEWSRRAGLDVWNLPGEQELLREATERRAEVNDYAESCARRREAADHVALRLAEGLPLERGTDEIMDLFRGDDGLCISLQVRFHEAPTARHAFALHAIDRVKRVLDGDPARGAAAVARLEAEYGQLLAEYRTAGR
jgi:hypothetical protein